MRRLVENPREWFSLLVVSVEAPVCEQDADASFLVSTNNQMGERQNKEQSNHYELSKSD